FSTWPSPTTTSTRLQRGRASPHRGPIHRVPSPCAGHPARRGRRGLALQHLHALLAPGQADDMPMARRRRHRHPGRWGRRSSPLTMWTPNKRYHGLNYEEISYDVFGFPHESLHTANEVLSWFAQTGIEYMGSFAPLRFRDYLFAFSPPEYRQFRET